MRIRVRRRKIFLSICKISICIFVILSLYLFLNSKSTELTVKKPPAFNLKVFIIEDENDAISIWENYTRQFGLSTPGTFISISSHFKDGLHQLKEQKFKNEISFNDLINAVKQINFQTLSLVLTGLFSKIIWIYPMWIHNKYIYKSKEQYIGVNQNNLCLCSFIGNITDSNKTNCENLFPNFSNSVEIEDCHFLLNNHWTFLSMQEIYAVVSLNQITLPSPVMININLDFFTIGSSNDFTVINNAVESIQSIINSLFCIQQLSDEVMVEFWFSKLIENVPIKNIDELIQLQEMPDKLYCHSEPSYVRRKMIELVQELKNLDSEHLKEMSDTGICIREGFDSKIATKIQRFEICNGHKLSNNRNHCALSNNSCYDAEFHLQMEKIYKIFKENIKQPTIISVTRSTRNGIVSPKNQYYLENSLLSNLMKIYKLKTTDVIYAENLLGGSKGWLFRNEVIIVNTSNEISDD